MKKTLLFLLGISFSFLSLAQFTFPNDGGNGIPNDITNSQRQINKGAEELTEWSLSVDKKDFKVGDKITHCMNLGSFTEYFVLNENILKFYIVYPIIYISLLSLKFFFLNNVL